MSYIGNKYRDPANKITNILDVSGIAIQTSDALGANQVWMDDTTVATNDNGFMDISAYSSGCTTILSDQPCTIHYEYSNDGINTVETINAAYTTTGTSRVANFNLRSYAYLKVYITNGSISQTKLFFSLSLSVDNTFSASSMPTPVGAGNIAQVTKSVLHGEDQATGEFRKIGITGNDLNVHVTNFLSDKGSGSTITNVNTSNVSSQILAANSNRKFFSIFSISGTILISLGTTNSSSLFTARIITNGLYENDNYTGAVYAIGIGTVTITELT